MESSFKGQMRTMISNQYKGGEQDGDNQSK